MKQFCAFVAVAFSLVEAILGGGGSLSTEWKRVPRKTMVIQSEVLESEVLESETLDSEVAEIEMSLPEYSPDGYALLLLEKVNEARTAHGLPALSLDLTVSRLAYVRAQEASQQWSHTRPNGAPCYSVYEEYRIRRDFWTGENLANYMLQDAQLIVDSWMASEAHRNNILYPDYTAAGIAVYWSGEKYYIANLFRS